jgi:hypothetical protein
MGMYLHVIRKIHESVSTPRLLGPLNKMRILIVMHLKNLGYLCTVKNGGNYEHRYPLILR